MADDCVFFASCARGFEDLLQKECERLELTGIRVGNGGVHFTGNPLQGYRLCLWSRVASRVLLRLDHFEVRDDDQLYRCIRQIDWAAHLDCGDSFAVDCFTKHASINNSHFATLRVKDAIVDQFRERDGRRPDVVRDRPAVRINVYLGREDCQVYLDFSGEALHQRGYRRQAGSAPLRETLAAAILYRARWPGFHADGQPFFDPMCGSGTLLIEAAMMAADMAPGLLRDYFGFFGWKQFDPATWQSLREAAESGLAGRIESLPAIAGCDHSGKVLAIARQNIQAAGFGKQIHVQQADSTQHIDGVPAGNGLLVTNPPYGKRLGQTHQLRSLYLRFGKNLKQTFRGWTAAIFTSDETLAKSVGLRAFHKNTLMNGAIKCVLYQYRVHASATRRAGAQGTQRWSGEATGNSPDGEAAVAEQAQMFVNRLKKNARHLKKWARKHAIQCYRVYDADIPQYAVAIDRYDDWVHVQEYAAPKTVNQHRAFQRLNDVIDVVAEILEVDASQVVLKVRERQSGKSQYRKQDNKNRWLTVTESSLRFRINLYDYLDTGLFLDHRQTRRMIFDMAKGKHFLNLFAYTGSVSVYAAAGGAKSTTTVDMSNTYLQWAQENFRLNRLSGRQHRFLRHDCTQWVWDAERAGNQYDLIFLDPPTFSNSSKMQQAFDINRDHSALLERTMRLLSDDGRLVFSTNSKKFRLADTVQEAWQVKEITAATTTEDFRRKPQHRCWILQKPR